MKKVIYPEIIICAGIDKEEIRQFEYTNSDIRKLAKIIKLENDFANSPNISHHLKKKSSVNGKKLKFSDVTNDETVILSEFESGKAKFHATLCMLKIRENLYHSNSMLIASAAVEAGATACNIKPDLVMLNIGRNLMVKSLSIQSSLLQKSKEDNPYESMYVVLLLNNLALINCKMCNVTLALELYKQAWFLSNNFFISIENIPFMKNIKEILDKHVEGFTSNKNSACKYIADRGVDKEDDITILIKASIQKLIIDYCDKYVKSGKWDNTMLSYGLGSYLTPKYIAKVLSKSLEMVSDKTVEKAQMLCFQQICVVTNTSKNTICLDKFVDTYPTLALKILKTHPEYCIDGWLFSRVSKKLSENSYELEDVPTLVTTIDILLNKSDDMPEESKNSSDKDVETIGEIFT